MRKLPRHLTLRIDYETAEAFHARMALKGQTASSFLREVVKAAVSTPPDDVASTTVVREAA